MPLDNITPDARGDLWVPGFPDARKTMKGMVDPDAEGAPVSVFQIRRVGGGDVEEKLEYEVTKVLEDKEARVLDGSTTVLHDVKSGKLFLGSVVAPFLVVCEPR
ncbi:hypothetical protein C7974DRAFT_376190 [Boeremia exigua]|uniref:uncharacterized protein n=1 Tax=Boeremia exigua TaxID=749465 RepID=UPI001E8CA7F2|nr:uncharacterized protein C7974DRAFT_376190 [Boeremia exigua]KAH6629336.1 hypothetical protein C7974DRAFT_376190 [Boeremia exigua]